MGLLVKGEWQDRWYNTKDNDGRFVRKSPSFRGGIGPEGGHPAEADRYHLYVAWACPWAHRTLIFRALKGLEALIPITAVGPRMLDQGWSFIEARPDPLLGAQHLHQVYTRAKPDYTGRVTVPVLWDKKTDEIVNNESSEIIRIFNSAFDALTDKPYDFWPEALRGDIEAVNERVYSTVNNGVYRAGFATTQAAYDEAVGELFESLDWLEARLAAQPFLVGGRLTEADWRLFTTLMRFDLVYHTHFMCDRRRIVDYPNLWSYTRALYQVPGIAGTLNLAETREHYFYSHETVNPHRIISIGPELDFDAPHDRGRFGVDPLESARR
ncbi:MAG: glutathione S-transferase family protein [Alphaproteobacteria bacterium]|nr:glutathione S-transferase family protein [Alphaproteobacteria bacterium]